MKPQRPYLFRALYDWIVDSDEVPYIVVDATTPDVQVPTEHVQDGKIILNIGPNAVRDFVLEDDYLMCGGRFSGRHFELYLPMSSIRAIYAKATGQGMVFANSDDDSNDKDEGIELATSDSSGTGPSMGSISEAPPVKVSDDGKTPTDKEGGKKPGGGKPGLRLV